MTARETEGRAVAAAQAEIDSDRLEGSVSPRRLREALLTNPGRLVLQGIEDAIAAERVKLDSSSSSEERIGKKERMAEDLVARQMIVDHEKHGDKRDEVITGGMRDINQNCTRIWKEISRGRSVRFKLRW